MLGEGAVSELFAVGGGGGFGVLLEEAVEALAENKRDSSELFPGRLPLSRPASRQRLAPTELGKKQPGQLRLCLDLRNRR